MSAHGARLDRAGIVRRGRFEAYCVDMLLDEAGADDDALERYVAAAAERMAPALEDFCREWMPCLHVPAPARSMTELMRVVTGKQLDDVIVWSWRRRRAANIAARLGGSHPGPVEYVAERRGVRWAVVAYQARLQPAVHAPPTQVPSPT